MDTNMDIRSTSLFITQDILNLISEIDEFKGAWKSLGQLAPDQLATLKKIATIESIGSSTRIEGSVLSDKEVEILLNNFTIKQFHTRDEQEVAGYSFAMNLIFQNYESIPLTENYIQQIHQYLLQYSEKVAWHRGQYKRSPNHVEAFDETGKSLGIVFETSSPFETPLRMQVLIDWTNKTLSGRQLHPLLVTAIFIVEFLAIHPFQDGNGRLSHILTTLILLNQGYLYVPYSSLEAVVEQNKEGYYLSLRQTQGTLRSESPNWQPWIIFFLRTMQKQKRNLEKKLEKEQLLLMQLPGLSLQLLESIKSRGRITVKEAVVITQANRNTIKKHLDQLVSGNRIQRNGTGKATWYSLPVTG